MRNLSRPALLLMVPLQVGACGTYVPTIEEPGEQPRRSREIVQAILTNVTCEVQDALYDVLQEDRRLYKNKIIPERNVAWLEAWGVQIDLSITIDEEGTVNPSINALPPSPATAILNISADVKANTKATRISKLHSFHTVSNISAKKCPYSERPNGPFLMQSDLKLREWLEINARASSTGFVTYPLDAKGPFGQDVISHQVTFAIETSGGLTPGWKLTRVEINPSGSFLNASRTRTHDLTITLGPLDENSLKTGRAAPSRAAQDAALASNIGIAVANNIRLQNSPRIFNVLP